MIGSLVGQLLGSLATTGLATAGAEKLRHSAWRVAGLVAFAVVIGLLAGAAFLCFGAAIWYGLLPQVGAAGAAAITGLAFVVVAVIIGLLCRYWHKEPPHIKPVGESPLAGLAGLSPLLPKAEDVGQFLERNAGTAMLVAFAVGLLAGRRK
jgi:hypothetical protein